MIGILSVVGARPNFMKIAPLMAAMREHPDIKRRLVHTGQHYDPNLSDVFFDELGIPRPDIHLGIGGGSREQQIAAVRAAFEPVLLAERPEPVLDERRPDAVLVVGDVNATIACASVAKRHGVKVIHVEAGLRSFDQDMPEEHNRVETDRISDFLFVTEQSGLDNITREALPGKAFLVGNVMIDTLVANLERARRADSVSRLGLRDGEYIVATFHRPSNVDAREDLDAVIDTLEQLCERCPVVLPLHPRTRKSAETHDLIDRLRGIERLVLTEPLGYLEFMRLVSTARAVVTDSGGVQEETTYLGVPCLTMRENTERPVTIDIGTNVLIGSDRAKLLACIDDVLAGRFKKGERPPLWDGQAAPRIVDILREELDSTATDKNANG